MAKEYQATVYYTFDIVFTVEDDEDVTEKAFDEARYVTNLKPGSFDVDDIKAIE